MQKNAPSICRLHLNLSCKAHLAPRTEKKHEKTRPFAPSNRLSLTDTTKEKLVRSPSTSVILDAPFQPVATRQQTVKRKGGSNAPVQIILTAFGDNRKKTKTDTLATTIKKNAPQQVTPPPDNKSRKRRNRTCSAQSRLYLPTSPLPSAPFFCAALLQILCTALKPLKCRHTKRVEKTFNKKLIPRRKCRTLLTRNRPQTQTRNKKTRKKTSFTQNT